MRPRSSPRPTAWVTDGCGDSSRSSCHLAAPAIVAALRIATVTTVGLVTVTGLIGQGGYGSFINSGLSRSFSTEIVVGGGLSVVMAVALDVVLVGDRTRRHALDPSATGGAGMSMTSEFVTYVTTSRALERRPRHPPSRRSNTSGCRAPQLSWPRAIALPIAIWLGHGRRGGFVGAVGRQRRPRRAVAGDPRAAVSAVAPLRIRPRVLAHARRARDPGRAADVHQRVHGDPQRRSVRRRGVARDGDAAVRGDHARRGPERARADPDRCPNCDIAGNCDGNAGGLRWLQRSRIVHQRRLSSTGQREAAHGCGRRGADRARRRLGLRRRCPPRNAVAEARSPSVHERTPTREAFDHDSHRPRSGPQPRRRGLRQRRRRRQRQHRYDDCGQTSRRSRIGAQDFGESTILAEIYKQGLAAKGYDVSVKTSAVSATCRDRRRSTAARSTSHPSTRRRCSSSSTTRRARPPATSAATVDEARTSCWPRRSLTALLASAGRGHERVRGHQGHRRRLGLKTLSDLAVEGQRPQDRWPVGLRDEPVLRPRPEGDVRRRPQREVPGARDGPDGAGARRRLNRRCRALLDRRHASSRRTTCCSTTTSTCSPPTTCSPS